MAIEQVSGAAEMVASGDQQIAELEQHIILLEQSITEIDQEIDLVEQTRIDQAQLVTSQRQHVTTLEQEHIMAQSYAQLAQGTGRERASISQATAAKRAWIAAQKALLELSGRIDTEKAEATTRELELSAARRAFSSEVETRRAELESVQRGMQRAEGELGHEVLAAATSSYRSIARQVEALKKQLVSAQMELAEIHEQGVNDLTRWPPLCKQFASMEEPNDPTYRVVCGTLEYMDVLTENAAQMRMGEIVLPFDLREVLFIHEEEVYQPNILHERFRRLRMVKDALLEYLRS